jgi:aspergillopepsin I
MTNTEGMCFGGIQTLPGIPLIIIGAVFLKSQYVVFDLADFAAPRIGFGQQQ